MRQIKLLTSRLWSHYPGSPDTWSCLWPRRQSSGCPPPRPWAPWRGWRGWCPLSPGQLAAHCSLCCGGGYLSSPGWPGPHSRHPPHFSLTSAWTGRERAHSWGWSDDDDVMYHSDHFIHSMVSNTAELTGPARSKVAFYILFLHMWAEMSCSWLAGSLVSNMASGAAPASHSAVTSSGLKLTGNQLIRIFH